MKAAGLRESAAGAWQGLGRAVRVFAAVAASAGLVGLAGCASDRPKPVALENLAGKPTLSVAWSARAGGVDFPLRPSVAGDRIASVDADGAAVVRRLDTGAEVWRASAGSKVSAGAGFDGTRMAVVTRSNELLVLRDGKVQWRKRLGSKVSTAPLVAGERVFVMGVDRGVDAFDAEDGRYLWRYARPSDALTLSQAGVLSSYQDTLLIGQGARLTGLDPTRGTVRWEVALATPRGTNEVERLADLVGPPARVDTVVCARAFQSAVGCADVSRASLLWSRNTGGTEAVAADARMVVGADGSDRLSGWRRETGELAWNHERLLNRGLSGGVSDGKVVVFGDSQGYVHVFAPDDGRTLARGETDGSAVIGTPILRDGRVIVSTRKGGLYALRLP